jgi:hypothetical protein
MSEDPYLEYALNDGTIVQVHQKRPAQKEASASGHWALAQWANDKDRRVDGCARRSGSVSAAAGASA